ncbi:MAG TPA: methyltransferase [Allosphingosinicella sp.]|nr:methyltransferase [Allosphingosinicella sp.]
MGFGVDAPALAVLRALGERGYDFVPVTPETHRRVIARPDMALARDLRGVFGWSLPFDEALLPGDLFALLRDAGFLASGPPGWRSKVRVSSVAGRLFLHSAYPTEAPDSVFLGPDSVRFADFLRAELAAGTDVRRLVDIGAGAGVGGIVAAGLVRIGRIELVDLNEAALSLARINAAHAGIDVETYVSDGAASVPPGFDLAIANPPFIMDEGGPVYRAGGGMRGAELSIDWASDAAARLAPGGRMLLYTGTAIVAGRDWLREALEARIPALRCTLRYREIDPDIFGEELEKPAYHQVERIAAVGAVIHKEPSAPLS